MFAQVFLFACTATALVSICQSVPDKPLPSPCPELFTYETVNNQGYWTGSLILRPDYDLRGIWIRLIFDKDIKDLTVNSNFTIKHDSGNMKLIKLQSPDLNLAADETKILTIKVTYEGSETPSLIEYRLNARTICPQANIENIDVFKGDTKSDYFLQSLQTKRDIFPQKYECGLPHQSNSHPWQAAIYLHVNKEELYSCDATLISPSYVITSAHCVTLRNESTAIPRSIVAVKFGPDLSAKNAFRSFVRDITIHPGYEPGFLSDDVAILRLVNPVDITKDFRPICLGLEYKPDYDNKIFISSYELKEDEQPDNVLKSEVSKVDSKECLTVSPNFQNVLTYDTYCVSYKPGDKNCIGISGSGLVSIEEGKTTLRGLVSLGIRLQNKSSCNDKTNVIITDIGRYLSFINNVIF